MDLRDVHCERPKPSNAPRCGPTFIDGRNLPKQRKRNGTAKFRAGACPGYSQRGRIRCANQTSNPSGLSAQFRRLRPPIPTDRDQLFRSIATSAARVLTAPLDDGCDVSLLGVGQARREAVPVVNRRDPRAPRRALTAGAAARAGGPC